MITGRILTTLKPYPPDEYSNDPAFQQVIVGNEDHREVEGVRTMGELIQESENGGVKDIHTFLNDLIVRHLLRRHHERPLVREQPDDGQ